MIRLLRKRVEPPTDQPVQWFSSDGRTWIGVPTKTVTHWCLPATLTEPSGPVHSLEPEELPKTEVQIRVRGFWFHGWLGGDGHWRARVPSGGFTICDILPDAWRPLPDDEPGDEELLEAAREVCVALYASPTASDIRARVVALRAIVEKRSGKVTP